MALPKSLDKLKEIGFVKEDYEICGVTFTMRNIASQEHLDVLNVTSAIADDALRWEVAKQKTLEYSIQTVDGQKIDDKQELMAWLNQCNPNIIGALFSKYVLIANKAAQEVADNIEKIEFVDSNLPNAVMETLTGQPTPNPEQVAENDQ